MLRTTSPYLMNMFVFSWAVLIAAPSQAGDKEIILHIQEHAGVSRSEWPVTGGVPFGRGELTDPAKVELLTADGSPTRLQVEPLARWEDASIKWLLVDFFASLEPGETQQFRLHYGTEATSNEAMSSPLSWRRTKEGIHIDTGVLRAVVSRRFLERLSIQKPSGQWIELISEPGELWISVNGERAGHYLSSLDAKAEIAVEQEGPNRISVVIRGWHHTRDGQAFGPYTLRVHAYAGKPYLRVFHTFVNSDLPERGLITGIGLRAQLNMKEPRALHYGNRIEKGTADWPSSLEQIDWNSQQVVHNGSPISNPTPVPGYLAVANPDAIVATMVRHWSQLYPKKLELNSQGLTFWIWPDSRGPWDLRREEQKQSEGWLWFKENYPEAYREWNDPGTAKSAGVSARRYREALQTNRLSLLSSSSAFGLARTHESLWVFGNPALQLQDLSAAFEEPLSPFVDPHYLDQTEVFGRLGWQDPEGFPLVENYFRRKLDWIMRHQNEWSRWWGILDWGGMRSTYESLRETVIPGQWLQYMGRHGWRNGEVDIPNHIMVHYLRTGDRRIFRFYESILRHQMDVDTIHLNHPDFEAAGHQWKSGEWTRGGMHRHSYNHYSGGDNIGHTWNEGIANYYFLTGDRRAYDVALAIGEYSLGAPYGKVQSIFEKQTTHPRKDLRFSRNAANSYRNALKSYELSGHSRWKDEAMRWRKYFLDHSPQYLDQQPATFHVTNYLARTLALDYHIFQDPGVARELVLMARWHLGHMKQGYDERGLHYPYLACALAWWITGDDELLRWPWHRYLGERQSAVALAQSPGDFRQAEFYELGQLPFFLRACREAGFSEAKSPEPLPVASQEGQIREE